MNTRLPRSVSVIVVKNRSRSSGWRACIAMNSSLRAASAGSMTSRSSSPRDAAARILRGQEHQIGVDRVGVQRVELGLVTAGESALDHVGDAQVAELAAGVVGPDDVDGRVELRLGGFRSERLEQADLPQHHALACAVLVLRDDRQGAGGAAGGDHLERCLRVESVDPLVDAVAAVGVDLRTGRGW